MKLVLNKCYGGFDLSFKAIEKLRELEGGKKDVFYYGWKIDRSNLSLVAVVEELGDEANTQFSELVVVEIPDGYEYRIDDYDGIETAYYGMNLGEI